MSLGHSRRFERSLGSCAVRLDNQEGSSLAWMYTARLDNRGGSSLAWMCAARLANRGLVTWPSVTALHKAFSSSLLNYVLLMSSYPIDHILCNLFVNI